jgi:hypothetical protein
MARIAPLIPLLWLAAILLAQEPQPTLAGACKSGGAYPQCDGGEIVFTGTNFSGQVHVKVTNSNGDKIDDGDYNTTDGILRFVENLSFADTYTIAVNGKSMLTVCTQ